MILIIFKIDIINDEFTRNLILRQNFKLRQIKNKKCIILI